MDTPPKTERDRWQQKCLDIGFKYWRAPDAHGVTCTSEQAVEFLQEVLGVEVEIESKRIPVKRVVEFDSEECPECGSQMLTVDADDPELLTDGDAVKCDGCDGAPHGFIACDSETPTHIIWKR